jgi:hypothetical protein
MGLLRKEEKFRKHINALSNWKESCLEAIYPNYSGIEIPYLPWMDYDFCVIVVSSVIITNAIPTLIYFDYREINSISYLVANEYSRLNAVLFVVLLDEWLLPNNLVSLDYYRRIYWQSPEPFTIDSMNYNISLLCGIKLRQLPVCSIERCSNGDDIICDNDVIEVNHNY